MTGGVRLTPGLRRHVRRGLLGGVAVALAGVAALVVSERPPPTREAPPPDGTVVRGFRTTRSEGARLMLGIAADEVRVERQRFGPFRLGFAHRLVARNATIEIRAAGGGLPPPPRQAATRRANRTAITALRVDGLELRVLDPAMARLTVHAVRCEGDLWSRGLVVCRGVRARGDDLDERLAAVAYDPAHGRLVPYPPATQATSTVAASVERLNRRLEGLGPEGLQALGASLDALRL